MFWLAWEVFAVKRQQGAGQAVPEEVRALHVLGQRSVCCQIFREFLLHKFCASIVIIESQLPTRVHILPRLYKGQDC